MVPSPAYPNHLFIGLKDRFRLWRKNRWWDYLPKADDDEPLKQLALWAKGR